MQKRSKDKIEYHIVCFVLSFSHRTKIVALKTIGSLHWFHVLGAFACECRKGCIDSSKLQDLQVCEIYAWIVILKCENIGFNLILRDILHEDKLFVGKVHYSMNELQNVVLLSTHKQNILFRRLIETLKSKFWSKQILWKLLRS